MHLDARPELQGQHLHSMQQQLSTIIHCRGCNLKPLFFTEVGEGLTFRGGGEVNLNVEVVCGEQVVRRRGGGGGGRGRG